MHVPNPDIQFGPITLTECSNTLRKTDTFRSQSKDGGFTFGFDAVRCKFKPTEAMLQLCEESGTDLAQAVKKTRKKKQSNTTKQIAQGGAAAGAR